MAMTGLFSGVDPELIRQQEAEKRQGNNLALAQSSNPFASTMFTGLNLADELRNKTADVFGNPIADSPAVAAAKEEKLLEEEVARMVMEGRQAGKKNSDIAQEVQAFLQGKGKFNKAEQYRTNLITEEQNASKTDAEIKLKAAQAAKAYEEAGQKDKARQIRLAALKNVYPKASIEELAGFAEDDTSFQKAMAGTMADTVEGVQQVLPGSLGMKRIGSTPDKASKTIVDFGKAEVGKESAKELVKTQSLIDEYPGKLAAIDDQLKTVQSRPLITGAFAEQKVAIANAFASVGLSTPENMDKLTNTQAFTAAQKSLVMKDLDNKLGSAISDGDRKFIESKFGELSSNPKALEEILTRIREVYVKDAQKLRTKEKRLLTAVNTGKVEAVEEQNLPPKPTTKSGQMPTREQILADEGFKKFLQSGGAPANMGAR